MNKGILSFMFWTILLIAVIASVAFNLNHFETHRIDSLIAAIIAFISMSFMIRIMARWLKRG